MREIKFRVYDRLFEQMISWENVKGKMDFESLLEYECHVPMQYTGLQDKNGTDIYEGDIVTRTYLFNGAYGKTHTGEVVFDNDFAEYIISKPNRFLEPKTESLRNTLSNASTYEVIGNVYENPDLIGGN